MRSRRGYTIMEVGLVTVLSTALLVGAMRWLIGLGGVVNATLDEAETSTLHRAAQQFAADVASAQSCQPMGTDASISLVSPSTVRLTTLSGGDLKSVTWSVSGGQLLRAEDPVASDCAYVTPTAWVTWSANVDPDESGFQGVRSGALVPLGTDGSCEVPWVSRCRLDAIDVEFKSADDALVVHYVTPVSAQ